MGIQELSVGRAPFYHVDPRTLKVRAGWNSRAPEDEENKAHVLALADSIAEIGVLEPLTVFLEKDALWVIDGHCRLAATLIAIKRGADIKSIPVKTEGGRGINEADRVFSQIARNSGKPLTLFEQGTVYKRLVAYGWTVEDIARKAGKGVSHVNSALDLQGAPAEVRKLVASGRVAPSLALRTVKEQGGEKAAQTLSNAVDAAMQQGKTHATARHIGEAPKAARKQILTRVKELFDESEGTRIDDTATVGVVVKFTDSAWAELARILDI
jgi:ParB family chromosome partitioning protein